MRFRASHTAQRRDYSLPLPAMEEGPAQDGTVALLDWMATEGEAMSVLSGGRADMPGSRMGEMMKIPGGAGR